MHYIREIPLFLYRMATNMQSYESYIDTFSTEKEPDVKIGIRKKNKEISTEEKINKYNEINDFLKENGIKISTITMDCKLHTLVDLDAFAKYVVLKEAGIVSIKYGHRGNIATNRTIIFVKPKKKASQRNFYNQVTVLIRPTNGENRKCINIKVFKNGSLQMTGCKDINDFNDVTSRLVNILKQGGKIRNSSGVITRVKFIEDVDEIGIFDVNIRMINSNFKLNYKVDRKELDKLLRLNHSITTRDKEIGYVDFKYDPSRGHSCINIKYYNPNGNKTSIFVFQTGSIIITGAKNLEQIQKAYIHVSKILERYRSKIEIIEYDKKKIMALLKKYENIKSKKNIRYA